MFCLWRCFLTVIIDTGESKCWLNSLAAVIIFLEIRIPFKTRRSLSLSFSFRPLFCFAELVLPRCVYDIMALDTVPLEMPKSWDVSVTVASSSPAPTIWPQWKSVSTDILRFWRKSKTCTTSLNYDTQFLYLKTTGS